VRRLHKVRTWEATRLDERGSTLIEVLVAALVLTTGVIAAAQLVSIATLSNVSARTTTTAVILAGQKAEQLRALAGAMLLPSPPASLQQNTPGFVEHLDARGIVVGVGSQAPPASVYTRRWTVEPRASGPGGLVLARVLVTPHRDRGRADAIPGARLPGEATHVTIITRRAAP
jgi:Tfp pilus assembly protein PilV